MRTLTILRMFLFTASAVLAGETTSLINTLNFFIVSDTPITGGRYIDTPEFPKLGHISSAPNFVVTNLSSVTTNSRMFIERYQGQKKTSIETVVVVTMEPADAKKFAELTRENIDRQLVMMLGKRPLVAPYIRQPIETPISIRVGSKGDLSTLVQELKLLVTY